MAKITIPAPGAGPAAGRIPARPPVSPALTARLAGKLTGRDRWLLRMLHEHRVLTTTQIIRLGYGAPRRVQTRLGDLHRLRAIDRFRPLATATAGSAPYHWVLDQAGAEVLAVEDALTLPELGYRRDRALDIAFSPRLAHTTGVNGLFTALAAARDGGGELACWWSERRCAAVWGDLARPDGYGLCRDPDGQAADFFAEYDTGTEDLPKVMAKLAGYRELAARTGIATPVLFWLASGPRREQHLRALLTEAGPVPGVPVATATPASAAAAGGPAGAAWLPAWQPGPRLRLARLTPRQAPAQPPGADTGLPWHPPVPQPPPGQAIDAVRPAPRDTP
jgi:Replication-relaxation